MLKISKIIGNFMFLDNSAKIEALNLIFILTIESRYLVLSNRLLNYLYNNIP